MKTYKLSSGYEMPLFGLGTWKAVQEDELYNAVREAITIGYRHFDCAKIYANEAVVGKALNDAFRANEVKREEIFVTSKLWNDSHAQGDVIPALQSTLRDLGLDYLDLYLIHWPVCFKKGTEFPTSTDDFIPPENLPISQTWQGMEKAVGQGLAKSIGVSNFSIKKLKELDKTSKIKPANNQVELHPYLQQKELSEYCNANNIALTAYSPLGSMDRPSSLKPENEPSLLEDAVIARIAQKHNATPAQVLIKWHIQRGVAVIPKSTNFNRLKENHDAQFVGLDEPDMKKIASLERNFRYLTGSFFTQPGSGYTLENIWDEV